MYNGIGLETVRGSGTNGFVTRNLSALRHTKDKVDYKSEEQIKKLDGQMHRGPNKDILEHDRLRKVELKCMEMEELMEEQGYNAEDVDRKVSVFRKMLMEQTTDTSVDMDDAGRPIAKATHQIAEASQMRNEQLKMAFGIGDQYKEGSAFDKERKTKEIAAKSLELATKNKNMFIQEESSSSSSSSESEPEPKPKKRSRRSEEKEVDKKKKKSETKKQSRSSSSSSSEEEVQVKRSSRKEVSHSDLTRDKKPVIDERQKSRSGRATSPVELASSRKERSSLKTDERVTRHHEEREKLSTLRKERSSRQTSERTNRHNEEVEKSRHHEDREKLSPLRKERLSHQTGERAGRHNEERANRHNEEMDKSRSDRIKPHVDSSPLREDRSSHKKDERSSRRHHGTEDSRSRHRRNHDD